MARFLLDGASNFGPLPRARTMPNRGQLTRRPRYDAGFAQQHDEDKQHESDWSSGRSIVIIMSPRHRLILNGTAGEASNDGPIAWPRIQFDVTVTRLIKLLFDVDGRQEWRWRYLEPEDIRDG